jgi:hypothetical protein
MILIPNGARVGAEVELYPVAHAARYVVRPDHYRLSPMQDTSVQALFGIYPVFSRPFSASF